MSFYYPRPIVPIVPAKLFLDESGRMRAVPDINGGAVIDLNSPSKVPAAFAFTSDTEPERIRWRVSNLIFEIDEDTEDESSSSLTIAVHGLKGLSPFCNISVEGVNSARLMELVTVDDLRFTEHEGRLAVTPESLSALLNELRKGGGEILIRDIFERELNEKDFFEEYKLICSRPHRWQGSFLYSITEDFGQPFCLLNKESTPIEAKERPNTAVITSTSMSQLNADERKECANLIVHSMEASGVEIGAEKSKILAKVKEGLIECRLTVPEQGGGVHRLRLNLYLDDNSGQLFIVYDPWVKSSSRRFEIDGAVMLKELLEKISQEEVPRSGSELFVKILGEVASSNETEIRNLHTVIRDLEDKLTHHSAHPAPNAHVTAMRSLTYLRTRLGITSRDLNNHLEAQTEHGQTNGFDLKRTAGRFLEAQRSINELLTSHEASLNLADVLASRNETAARHNSDDIIRGGTVGILGGTFALVVWEISHWAGAASSLGIVSAGVIAAYGAKIFFRSRAHGLSIWDSIKKVF